MKRLKEEGLGLITEEENIHDGAAGPVTEDEAKDVSDLPSLGLKDS
jgi:hypothetical protein